MHPVLRTALLGGSAPGTPAADAALTSLRVAAGLAMAFAHGLGKVPPSEGFIGAVGGMGFPAPVLFAWLAGLAEVVGGLLLAVGLMTRPAAFSILITMVVAFFIRHGDDPFRQKELAFLFMFISLAFVFLGSGRFGLDRFLRKSAKGETAD
ncbi:MAG: DoxX family protein [Deltaproteobacteria bacterium]|nr:MAG: DoxX family protein [Deltaproteobacteria bacterium]